MDNNTNTEVAQRRILFPVKLLILLVILFIILGGGVYILSTHFINPEAGQTPQSFITYNDPWGYFSMKIPNSWTTSRDIAEGTVGLGTANQQTQDIEENQLAQSYGTGVEIQIYLGAPACPLSPPPTATFAGLPASYDPLLNAWTISVTKATIVITVAFPDSGAVEHGGPIPLTPVPQNQVQQDKLQIAEALKTLKLAPLTPMKCE